MITNLRFFYSDKLLLEDLKEKLQQENNDAILLAKHSLKIDFCLGVSLKNLQQKAVEYFHLLCDELRNAKTFSALEYYDLLDAIFYLFASVYDFKASENQLDFLLENIKVSNDDALKNYAKVYLLLILTFVCKGSFDKEIITKNKSNLKDLYPQFVGLLNRKTDILYEVISTDLTSIHRIKNLYTNNPKHKTNGYQDFSNMYATFGKIEFWKAIGIALDSDKLNDLFKAEFGKEMSYFNY